MGQELTLLKWVSLSAENIGMQKGDYLCRRKSSLQNPMSHYQTLSVNDIYSQNLQGSNTDSQNLYTSLRVAQTFRVSFSDAVNLRLTVSQVQKEKVWWKSPYLKWDITL
ncbi:hypothetical protein ABLA76_15820 [Xenorhabdus sp. SGI240]